MSLGSKHKVGSRLSIWEFSPSLTKQSFKDECDINRIVARGLDVAYLESAAVREPLYADVSNVPDYRSALDIVIAADRRFMEMPAEMRERFLNDPSKMVDFVSDSKNLEEARRLGLLKDPEKPVPPTRVEVVNPPPVVDDKSAKPT